VGENFEDDLRLSVMRLARRIRLEKAGDDLTDARLSALSVLRSEGPQTLGSLSEHERVSPPSMNRTVGALVELGYVSRVTSPGRKVIIDLTADGEAVVAETRRRRTAWFHRQLDGLGDDELDLLHKATPLLRRLSDS
jgi:DNA-binding MarR family transcriptional regulator